MHRLWLFSLSAIPQGFWPLPCHVLGPGEHVFSSRSDPRSFFLNDSGGLVLSSTCYLTHESPHLCPISTVH